MINQRQSTYPSREPVQTNRATSMRGTDERSGELFSYVDLEQRVLARHQLRAIRGLVNEALANIGPELEAVYSRIGRPSNAPESCYGRCCCSCSTASAQSDR